jgi:phosphoglycolate phosphatase
VWVIGDTPADVRCGRAIGANVLAVATGIYPAAELAAVGPDRLVADFSDAEAVLDLWMSSP